MSKKKHEKSSWADILFVPLQFVVNLVGRIAGLFGVEVNGSTILVYLAVIAGVVIVVIFVATHL
jgi:hypothetical protein